MKIIQIASSSRELIALTDTGKLFSLGTNSSVWREVTPIPGTDPDDFAWLDESTPEEKVPTPLPQREAGTEPMLYNQPRMKAREIDPAELPEKLRNALDSDVRLCPACGMPWNGITCQECAI